MQENMKAMKLLSILVNCTQKPNEILNDNSIKKTNSITDKVGAFTY
jgi:hypothetical protein